MIPLILVGSRLYYVVFEWDQFKGNWRSIADFRQGGLAFYGGVIGGILAIMITAKLKRIKLHRLLDFFAVYVPLGQAIGRWGNFFNQEAFGSNTSLPWGMISEGTRQGLAALNRDLTNFCPASTRIRLYTRLFYEFIANIIIFVVLIFVRRRSSRPWVTVHVLSSVRIRSLCRRIRPIHEAKLFPMIPASLRCCQPRWCSFPARFSSRYTCAAGSATVS